jgi:DNA-binding response OmpR family regulator
VVVADLDTPQLNDGIEIVAEIKALSPTSMILALTPRKSYDDAVAAIRAGAVDIIFKSPKSVDYLRQRVIDAAARSVDKREVNAVLAEVRSTQEEFLNVLMAAERRVVDLEDRAVGRDPASALEDVHILLVDQDPSWAQELCARPPPGYSVDVVLSGGEALDRVGTRRFHIAMVGEDVVDLPATMVRRSIKAQSPDTIVLSLSRPEAGRPVEVADTSRRITVINEFRALGQLVSSLDQLAQAFRAKARERRYAQAFRERNYDFLRRYVELKAKIERVLAGIN